MIHWIDHSEKTKVNFKTNNTYLLAFAYHFGAWNKKESYFIKQFKLNSLVQEGSN